MGLFSSMRPERQSARSEQSPRPNLPELTRGMTINVTLPDGDTLLSGRLVSFSSAGLALERLPRSLSFRTCDKGETVYVRGCNQKLAPFVIQGKVQESTRTLFRMNELKPIPIEEHRDNFRLVLNSSAALYYLTDTRFQNPEECTLVDISVGGACIQSEYLHAEGEALNLKIKLEDYAAMEFLGEIIRVQELKSGMFQYGFLFAQLTEEEITCLAKTIYNIQVGNRSALLRVSDSSL